MTLIGWITEDGLQTTEEGLDILEDDQRFCFLQINKDRLNPFKCSEMILNYKGKMLDEVNRTEGDLQTTEDDLLTTEDDRGMMENDKKISSSH